MSIRSQPTHTSERTGMAAVVRSQAPRVPHGPHHSLARFRDEANVGANHTLEDVEPIGVGKGTFAWALWGLSLLHQRAAVASQGTNETSVNIIQPTDSSSTPNSVCLGLANECEVTQNPTKYDRVDRRYNQAKEAIIDTDKETYEQTLEVHLKQIHEQLVPWILGNPTNVPKKRVQEFKRIEKNTFYTLLLANFVRNDPFRFVRMVDATNEESGNLGVYQEAMDTLIGENDKPTPEDMRIIANAAHTMIIKDTSYVASAEELQRESLRLIHERLVSSETPTNDAEINEQAAGMMLLAAASVSNDEELKEAFDQLENSLPTLDELMEVNPKTVDVIKGPLNVISDKYQDYITTEFYDFSGNEISRSAYDKAKFEGTTGDIKKRMIASVIGDFCKIGNCSHGLKTMYKENDLMIKIVQKVAQNVTKMLHEEEIKQYKVQEEKNAEREKQAANERKENLIFVGALSVGAMVLAAWYLWNKPSESSCRGRPSDGGSSKRRSKSPASISLGDKYEVYAFFYPRRSKPPNGVTWGQNRVEWWMATPIPSKQTLWYLNPATLERESDARFNRPKGNNSNGIKLGTLGTCPDETAKIKKNWDTALTTR